MLAAGQFHQIGPILCRWKLGPGSPEWIGCHQAVAATVPVSGILVRRIVEDCQTDFLALQWPRVIAPRRQHAPYLFLADLALGVFELARALFGSTQFFAQLIANANAERAF